MKDLRLIIDEKELSYDKLIQIREHAKGYNDASDKKEFLNSIGAYEQKLILLNSYKPYDVLNYLSELNTEVSNLVLRELNYDDVLKILPLFTLEQKRDFYKNFPSLPLVNSFIVYDKESNEYIDDLTLERKVDLLSTSTKETIEAASIVYESIPDEQKNIVADKVATTTGSTTLNEVISRENELFETDSIEKEITNVEKLESNKEEIAEEEENKVEEKEEKEEKEETQLEIEEINSFLKTRMDYYKESIPEFKELNFTEDNIFLSLPPHLQERIAKEFEVFINERRLEQLKDKQNELKEDVVIIKNEENNVDNIDQTTILNEFNEAKGVCEQQEIGQIVSSINQNSIEEVSKVL